MGYLSISEALWLSWISCTLYNLNNTCYIRGCLEIIGSAGDSSARSQASFMMESDS